VMGNKESCFVDLNVNMCAICIKVSM